MEEEDDVLPFDSVPRLTINPFWASVVSWRFGSTVDRSRKRLDEETDEAKAEKLRVAEIEAYAVARIMTLCTPEELAHWSYPNGFGYVEIQSKRWPNLHWRLGNNLVSNIRLYEGEAFLTEGCAQIDYQQNPGLAAVALNLLAQVLTVKYDDEIYLVSKAVSHGWPAEVHEALVALYEKEREIR